MEKYFRGSCLDLMSGIMSKTHMEIKRSCSYGRTTEYQLGYNFIWELIRKPVTVTFLDFGENFFRIDISSPEPSLIFSNSGKSFRKVCKTIEKFFEDR